VELNMAEPNSPFLILKYMNRLSDYLFVLARYIGHINGVEEIKWTPRN